MNLSVDHTSSWIYVNTCNLTIDSMLPISVTILSRLMSPILAKPAIWIRSRRWACLVTWFCYHWMAKPGNKTGAPFVTWPIWRQCLWRGQPGVDNSQPQVNRHLPIWENPYGNTIYGMSLKFMNNLGTYLRIHTSKDNNKVWNEITYLPPNFNPHFTAYLITYPCWDWIESC